MFWLNNLLKPSPDGKTGVVEIAVPIIVLILVMSLAFVKWIEFSKKVDEYYENLQKTETIHTKESNDSIKIKTTSGE